MILRTPCEFFLKGLIVHPDKYDDQAIQAKILDLGLDDLGNSYIEKLRKKLRPPTPFYPNDPLHIKSQRFLIQERIQSLFNSDADMRTAKKILEFPRHKEFVESMLIAHAPSDAIAEGLTIQRRFKCNQRAVDLYGHYFWNVDLVDSVEIRAILRLRVDRAAASENPDHRRQADHLKNASYNDPRRITADLPFSPLTAIMAQMRMGLMPAQINLPMVISRTREVAAMAAYEAVCNRGPRDSQRARDFADVVRTLSEVLETVVKPDEMLRDELQAIALRTEEQPVPSIHRLSGGHHTADMNPATKAVDDSPFEHDHEPASSGPTQG